MALSGDLAHFSIVDLIQLLHNTRKTGTLTATGGKGEISISFSDGFIVGARHYSDQLFIGKILVESGVIDEQTLAKALALQKKGGKKQAPLIAILIENSLAEQEDAYRGLERLIEFAIVELLTWRGGSFNFLPGEIRLCDEFRYLPDKLGEALMLPAEHLLLDALRIFDEKMRDGLLELDEEPLELSEAMDTEQDGRGEEPYRIRIEEDTRQSDKAAASDVSTTKRQGNNLNLARLKANASLPETVRTVLDAVATMFPRALTLVVWNRELVAERGVGISSVGSSGAGQILGFRIPIGQGTVLSSVVESGKLFFGQTDDQSLSSQLYNSIGKPVDNQALLLPLKLGNRVIAMIYGDFGGEQPGRVDISQLERCAELANSAIANSLKYNRQ